MQSIKIVFPTEQRSGLVINQFVSLNNTFTGSLQEEEKSSFQMPACGKEDGTVFVITSLVELLYFIYVTTLKDKHDVNF